MIHVIASIQVSDLKEFLKLFQANVPKVLAEEGCIEYQPAMDIDAKLEPQSLDNTMVTVIEKWESLDHLHAHLQAPHMLSFREQAGHLIQNVSLKVLQNP